MPLGIPWHLPARAPRGCSDPALQLRCPKGQLSVPNICPPYPQSWGFATPAMVAVTHNDLQGVFFVVVVCLGFFCYGPAFWGVLAIEEENPTNSKSNMQGMVPYHLHEQKLLLSTWRTQGLR